MPKQAMAPTCSSCCCYIIFPSCSSLCLKKLCPHHQSCALSSYFCILVLCFPSTCNLIPLTPNSSFCNPFQFAFSTCFGPSSGLGTIIRTWLGSFFQMEIPGCCQLLRKWSEGFQPAGCQPRPFWRAARNRHKRQSSADSLMHLLPELRRRKDVQKLLISPAEYPTSHTQTQHCICPLLFLISFLFSMELCSSQLTALLCFLKFIFQTSGICFSGARAPETHLSCVKSQFAEAQLNFVYIHSVVKKDFPSISDSYGH